MRVPGWLQHGWAIVSVAVATACGGTTTEEVSRPSDIRCPITLTPLEPIPATGAAVQAGLSATRDCTWSVDSVDPGLEIEPRQGQGNGTLSIVVGTNPLGRVRPLTLRINQQAFTLQQEPTPCRFTVTPSDADVPAEGGRVRVRLDTLVGCAWTVIPAEPWIQVVAPREGDTSEVVHLSVHSNPADRRSSVVHIGPVSVAIRQASIAESARGCPYSIGKGAANFPAEGGEAIVRLHTRPNCAWGVTVSDPWIVILSEPQQIGTGDIRYRVEPNGSTRRRTGTIVAGGSRHIVNQAGTRPAP